MFHCCEEEGSPMQQSIDWVGAPGPGGPRYKATNSTLSLAQGGGSRLNLVHFLTALKGHRISRLASLCFFFLSLCIPYPKQ